MTKPTLNRPFFDYVNTYCDRIQNGRKLSDIFAHGEGEMRELAEELNAETPGEDGVVGEAVDVILCMMDLIRQADPNVDNKAFLALCERKLMKWERKYANSIEGE